MAILVDPEQLETRIAEMSGLDSETQTDTACTAISGALLKDSQGSYASVTNAIFNDAINRMQNDMDTLIIRTRDAMQGTYDHFSGIDSDLSKMMTPK